jgi:uncharacterized protein YbaP (TraB family)
MKLILAMAALALSAFAADAAPPIWHVRGPHAEIALFGSVHLLSKDVAWRTPAFDADLARADEVWFEIPFDPTSQQAAQQIIVERGRLPPGETLSQRLTPEDRTALAKLEADEGVSPQAMEHFRPWLADTFLSLTYFERQGADAGLGVEQQISTSLPATVKRGAFETAAQQIGFFADMPERDQVEDLEQTLREIEDDPGSFARLANAWARGDTRTIAEEAVLKLKRETPGAYETLVVDRNRRWVDRITQLLQGDQRIFIVVGVGHLVGPDSVPALLRARGFKVEGP